VFIGDGPVHQQLVDEVNNLGLSDNVQFLGWRRDAHALLNCVDVVAHPTLQEAFPQIMIETMALNKPILITPVSGATDVIIDKTNGFLIPFRDSDVLANAIIDLNANVEFQKSVSQHAGSFVRAHYTKDKIIPTFEELYVAVT
jgi:glycosyltransferase involved in cell wall biosynthesis